MKALVTGGAGLVGRYIVEGLLAAGYQVAVAGRTAPPNDLFSRPVDVRAFALDAQDHPDALFGDASCLVHTAFDHVPGRYRGGEGRDPEGFRRRNLEGTRRLFEAAKRAGVRRAVFLSSRAVYDGLQSGIPLTEAAALAPGSLYGEVKLGCERALANLDGPDFCTASLRLTGVYGDLRPNKWDELMAAYLSGEAVPVRAGSEVHGSDVAGAVRLMLESQPALVAGRSFNVSDLVVDTRDILSPVKEAHGSPHPLPGPADTTAVAEMDCSRIRALGWQPGGRPLLQATLAGLAKPKS